MSKTQSFRSDFVVCFIVKNLAMNYFKCLPLSHYLFYLQYDNCCAVCMLNHLNWWDMKNVYFSYAQNTTQFEPKKSKNHFNRDSMTDECITFEAEHFLFYCLINSNSLVFAFSGFKDVISRYKSHAYNV